MTGRIARAVCALAVLATSAHAQPDALRGSGWPDVPSWWGAPGTVGWVPGRSFGAAPPFAFGGLSRGGWSLEEPGRAANARPMPGVANAWVPLTWIDSVEVVTGTEAAWTGFGAALTELRAEPQGTDPGAAAGRALSTFSFARGSSAEESNGVTVARPDSLLPMRVDALSWNRGAIGALEKAGRHLWGGSAGWVRGPHRFDAALTQRGAAAALAAGEEQSVTGLSGTGSWSWQPAADRVMLEVARAYDHHESVGDTLAPSRRDAQDASTALAWWRAGESSDQAVQLTWHRQVVARATEGRATVHAVEDAAWLAARMRRPLGGLALDAGLGGGWSGALDRAVVAPSFALSARGDAWSAVLNGERLVDPVWSDLAPGTAPFLQDTWTAGLTGAWRGRGWGVEGAVRSARTRDRAIASREPLEELWLRRGYRRDPLPFAFQLATLVVSGRTNIVEGGVEGFALHRTESAAQPKVDPGQGARAWLAGGIHAFGGDLLLHVRLEAAAIGVRESEASPSRRLPAYTTFDAVASATLADVVLTLRMSGLEDRPRPETWLDPRTGAEALGPGREFRLTVSWRLFD